MRRNSFIAIPQSPPTGTDAPPPKEGCDRIDTDQDDLAWPDIPQPYGELDWVRGATSLAVGKFEGYVYFENSPDQYDQHLILSQVTGTYLDAEDLERGLSAIGPWTTVSILADTPVDQVKVDCDIGCFGAECDPGDTAGQKPEFKTNPDSDVTYQVGTPPSIFVFGVDRPNGIWDGRYAYETDIPGGTALPSLVGTLTGQITGSVAEIVSFIDPFPSPGNIVLRVDGATLGKNATRFIHGETLDHGGSTAQITLDNPMLEDGPQPFVEP